MWCCVLCSWITETTDNAGNTFIVDDDKPASRLMNYGLRTNHIASLTLAHTHIYRLFACTGRNNKVINDALSITSLFHAIIILFVILICQYFERFFRVFPEYVP